MSGWFHHGEPFGRKKHHESIFVDIGSDPIPVSDLEVENFKENLRLYRDNSVNIHKRQGKHKGYPSLGENPEDQLVYYRVIQVDGKRLVYLSPAAIGREVFSNRLKALIKTYSPCDRLDALCPSCRLFGLVTDKGGAASRVRFSDAQCLETRDAKELYDSPVFLPELASPKPSATEFYLKRPLNAQIWNYDYAVNWEKGKPVPVPGYCAIIRGRKFYWHSMRSQAPQIQAEKASERNVFIRPLKSGNRFKSRIFFNRISEPELRRLLWVVTIGMSPDHAHKLGMGKPVGLGSVRIDVTDIVTRHIMADAENATIRYTLTPRSAEEYGIRTMAEGDLGCSAETLSNFMRITDYKNPPRPIQYPHNEDAPETYKWFMANKTIKGTGTAHVIDQELASIVDPYQYSYKEKTDTGGGKHAGQQDRGFHGKRRNTKRLGRAEPGIEHAPARPGGTEHARSDSPEHAKVAIHGMRGRVKFFDKEKNFGYIEPDDKTKDVKFFKAGFRSGQRVIFDVKEGTPIAINIRIDRG